MFTLHLAIRKTISMIKLTIRTSLVETPRKHSAGLSETSKIAEQSRHRCNILLITKETLLCITILLRWAKWIMKQNKLQIWKQPIQLLQLHFSHNLNHFREKAPPTKTETKQCHATIYWCEVSSDLTISLTRKSWCRLSI